MPLAVYLGFESDLALAQTLSVMLLGVSILILVAVRHAGRVAERAPSSRSDAILDSLTAIVPRVYNASASSGTEEAVMTDSSELRATSGRQVRLTSLSSCAG